MYDMNVTTTKSIKEFKPLAILFSCYPVMINVVSVTEQISIFSISLYMWAQFKTGWIRSKLWYFRHNGKLCL